MAQTRISRALSQPMYLIEVGHKKEEDEDFWAFKVEGYSGSQYKIHLRSTLGVRCSCPDFQQRRRFCKHVFFLFARILKQPSWAYRLAEEEDIETNVFDLFPTFGSLMGKVLSSRRDSSKKAIDDEGRDEETCPICFEKSKDQDRWVCSQCRYNIHYTCMERWKKRLGGAVRCPMCKKPHISLKRKPPDLQPLDKLKRVALSCNTEQ